jgi:hypothetical protein
VSARSARDHADEPALVVDHRKPVVARVVDEPSGLADGRVRGGRIGIGSHHVRCRRGERLPQPLLEPPERLEEDGAAVEVHVVRNVEVTLVIREHQIRLRDDPCQPALPVDHRHAGQRVLAQRRDDVLHARVGRHRHRIGVHDLPDQLRHGSRP